MGGGITRRSEGAGVADRVRTEGGDWATSCLSVTDSGSLGGGCLSIFPVLGAGRDDPLATTLREFKCRLVRACDW